MKNKISELSDKLFENLNIEASLSVAPEDFIRPTENNEISRKLQLYSNGRYFDWISDYLDYLQPKEINFLKFFESNIPLTDSMNPHKPYDLKEYFVTEIENVELKHLSRLKEFLKSKDNNSISLRENEGILHIGEKGSGKTFSQNIWLHENNDILEENNIFWVRLDASKLIRLWDDSRVYNNPNLTTIEEYFLGQIVYVFCKHCFKEYPLSSNLFVRILEDLKNSESNEIEETNIKTRAQADLLNNEFDIFLYSAHKLGFTKISVFLKDIERQIATYEEFYKGPSKRVSLEDRLHKDKSFLVDRVLKDSQKYNSDRYKGSKNNWMTIGRFLKNFAIKNGYSFLYIIDGLENINFYNSSRKNYLERIFSDLYNFPLNRFNSDPNETVLISLRDTTYEALKRMTHVGVYNDFNRFMNIESFTKVYQDTKGLQKYAFDRRVEYVLDKYEGEDCFMQKVLRVMIENHEIPDEERWNSNLRCFINNHVTLAKLITFRYYYSHKPKDFNILHQIKTFENINFFLNGELYVNELARSSVANNGHNLFNLFGFVDDDAEIPYYMIYSRLLQLINNRPNITEKKLYSILVLFDYTEENIAICLDNLIWSGLVFSNYNPKAKYNFQGKICVRNLL